jgi:steroid delta-isomerase-like uncharacterized protein
MTVLEANKALVRRYYDSVLNGRDAGVLDELLAADFRSQAADGSVAGAGDFRRALLASLAAFPDLHVEVVDQLAEGDRVATRWHASGTHEGLFAGIPPTGRRVRVNAVHIHRIGDGRIAEHWEQIDTLGMLRQLGI